MSRRNLILAELAFLAALSVVTVWLFRRPAPSADAVAVEVKLADPGSQVFLQRQGDGSLVYLVRHGDGNLERLAPAELSERLFDSGRSTASSLGLSSPIVAFWLGIGFLGQVLFTGRMVVQWVASERKKQSVVPPMFWWFSLIGSLLLLAYFLWRRDPIGLLGQAFGSFIYLKNILWIRNQSRPAAVPAAEAS